MSIDIVGNFLTTIRNAISIYKRSMSTPYSKFKVQIAQVLKDEGYIEDFMKEDDRLVVRLKYVSGESVIHEITRVSKPGCRRYEGAQQLKPFVGGLGITIITTNIGVITDRKAREHSVGGEVLCRVW